jgi:chaperonin GroES
MTAPYYMSETKSDMRGIKQGWYAIEDDGTLYSGPFSSFEECVIERIDAEAKTAGGIVIPDTAQEKPQQGKVIAVGPGGRDESGKLIPIDVKVGNRILFGKWSGTEVKIDGVEYLIMKESDIMGVLVETEAKNESRKKAA